VLPHPSNADVKIAANKPKVFSPPLFAKREKAKLRERETGPFLRHFVGSTAAAPVAPYEALSQSSLRAANVPWAIAVCVCFQ
jgi:hypothetical protein